MSRMLLFAVVLALAVGCSRSAPEPVSVETAEPEAAEQSSAPEERTLPGHLAYAVSVASIGRYTRDRD